LATKRRLYWDADVWISLIKKEAGRVDVCLHFITEAEKGNVEIWTSAFTLAEVFKAKLNGGSTQLDAGANDKAFEDFLTKEFVILVALDREVGTYARSILRQFGGSPADAVHIATAALNNAEELHSFDGKIRGKDQKVARADGTMLTICEPAIPAGTQPPLPIVGHSSGSTATQATS
jgi:predicted nucleic acid-binding protein